MTPARHIPEIDGLRALAVAVVLAFHLGYLSGGFLGVDLFFVISGFLITKVIAESPEGEPWFARFLIRRLQRLAPALLLVVAVTSLAAWLAFPTQTANSVFASGIDSLLYISNWRAIGDSSDYFAVLSTVRPLEHTWSLAIEEQFYVLWALLLAATGLHRVGAGSRHRRFGPVRVTGPVLTGTLMTGTLMTGTLLTASLAYGLSLAVSGQLDRLYYSTFARSAAMLAGALVYFWRRKNPGQGRPRLWHSIWLVGFGALLLTDADALAWGSLQASTIVGAMLLVAVTGNLIPGLGSVLGHRLVREVGLASYGIYLWHWPILVFARELYPDLAQASLAAIVVLGSMGLGLASRYGLEDPIRRQPSRPPLVAGLLATSLIVVGTLGVLGHRGNGQTLEVAGPSPTSTTAATSTTLTEGPSLNKTSPTLTESGLRDPAATDEAVRLLFLGDSQAASLRHHLPASEIPVGVDVGHDQILGCGIGPGYPALGDTVWTIGYQGDDCGQVGDRWVQKMAETEPAVTLVWSGSWDLLDRHIEGTRVVFGSQAWEAAVADQLDETLRRFTAVSGELYWMAAGCYYDIVGAASLSGRTDPQRTEVYNRLLRAAAKTHDVTVIDYDVLTCSGPDPERRWDGVHPTEAGAIEIWRYVLAEMQGRQ